MYENDEDDELSVQPQLNEVGLFRGKDQAFVHNFDGDLRKQWQRMSRAQGASVQSLADHLGEEISVRYVLAHRVYIRSAEHGEMVPAVRSVLITHEDKAYDTVSTQVANRVGEMLALSNGAPIDPPLVVRPVEVKARSGYRVLTLEAVE